MMINLRFGTLVLFIGSALVPTLAWTTTSPLMMSALSTNKNNHAGDDGSPSLFSLSTTTTTTTTRRDWMTRVVAIGTTAAVTATTTTSSSSAAWAIDTQTALSELESSMEKMKPIPDLLEDKEWDKVRSILKLPPVNKLWNLGDSQNTLLQLARETGNIDLFELKDDLAYNLQLCDQLTYDNAFVYFQPGNGKVNISEPKQLAKKAMKQIQDAIDLVKEG